MLVSHNKCRAERWQLILQCDARDRVDGMSRVLMDDSPKTRHACENEQTHQEQQHKSMAENEVLGFISISNHIATIVVGAGSVLSKAL